MPERIQRRRTLGWRMPRCAIFVGRPTVFGNPFRAVRRDGEWIVVDDNGVDYEPRSNTRLSAVQKSVALYRADLVDWGRLRDQPGLQDAITELRGHDLCCWCPLDSPCHGDVLLDIVANGADRA